LKKPIMKRSSAFRPVVTGSRAACLFAAAIAALLTATSASAATLYWDLNQDTVNDAGPLTGTWDGVNLYWNSESSGTGGTPTADTSSADDLVFSSGDVYTAGTVTTDGFRAASSLTFEDSIAVTLAGTRVQDAAAVTVDNTIDTISYTGTEVQDGQVVSFGGTLPTGLNAGRLYYIINATAGTYQVSNTPGGSVVGFSDDGESVTNTVQAPLTLGGSGTKQGIIVGAGAGPVTVNAPLAMSTSTINNVAAGTSLTLNGDVISSASNDLTFNNPSANTGKVTINGNLWLASDASGKTRHLVPSAGTLNITNSTAYLTRYIVGGSGAATNAVATNSNIYTDGNEDWADLNIGYNSKTSYDMHGGSLTTAWGGINMGLNSGSGNLTMDSGALVTLGTVGGDPGTASGMDMGDGSTGSNFGKNNFVTIRDATLSISANGALRVGIAGFNTDVINQLGGTVNLPYNTGGNTAWNAYPTAGLNLQYRMNREQLYAIYNLNGGTLTVGSILCGDGTTGVDSNNAYLNFHGGTLKPSGTEANFVRTTITGANAARGATRLTIYAEGAAIDTDGFDIGIQGPLKAAEGNGVYASGGGGLTVAATTEGSGYKATPQVILTATVVAVSSGTATSTSPVLTDLSSTTHILPGARIYGTNIPTGARVVSVDAGAGSVTMDLPASGTGSTGTTTVQGQAATAVANMADDGTGDGTLKIVSITVTNPGVGYAEAPTVSLSNGSPTTEAVIPALATAPNVSGGLTKDGDGTLTLSGANTYTGDTAVNVGTLTLADDAQLKFVIGDTSGVNNQIIGKGAVVLAGDFNIDTSLADASALTAGTWELENVATLTSAYEGTFQVVSGITPWEFSGDIWTKTVDTKTYTFDETTGTLTLTINSGGGGTYADWAILNEIPGAPGDGDADNDGVDNAVEMLVGGHPKNTVDTGLLPTLALVTNPVGVPAGNYLEFTYHRTQESVAAGVTAVCEYDTDLVAPWTPAVKDQNDVVEIETPNHYGAGIDRVQVYVPRSGDKLFGHLRVTVP
jgi:autotransporter-associated beta strand protein